MKHLSEKGIAKLDAPQAISPRLDACPAKQLQGFPSAKRLLKTALSLALAILLLAGTAPLLPARAHAAEPAYDPRDLDLMSDTRDQSPWGMCWAFAGMAALESYAIANGLADASIDLSEEAVPWSILAAAKQSEGISPAFGWMTRGTRSDSGYGDMMTGYFMSEKGPKLESDIPYYRGSESDPLGSYYTETPPAGLSTAKNVFEVTDIAYLGGASQDEIKDAIKKYGGVATGCDLSLELYNPDTAALWSPAFAEDYENHSICIVGWDDDFPRESFVAQDGKLPERNGAWLAKNSELADGEIAPYIWISYEDGTILQDDPHSPSYAIAGARPVTDRSVYALDSDGAVSTVSGEAPSGSDDADLACANVYEFADDERLSEVMFMTTSKGTGYRISYYPVDENLVPIVDSSRAVILAEGTVEHAGYTTVEIDGNASLPSGYGAIAIELTSENGPATLGVDENVNEYGRPLYTAEPQDEVRSFYLRDGAAEPAFSEPRMPVTFVLRAYGVEKQGPDVPSVDPGTPSEDQTASPEGAADPADDPTAVEPIGQTGGELARTGDEASAAMASAGAVLLYASAIAGACAFKLRRRSAR